MRLPAMPLPSCAHRACWATALVALSWALPCGAESLGSAASSASSAGSASSASLSDSVGGSSGGNAKKAQAAQGLYQVVDVSPVPGQPGQVQLRLALAEVARQPGDEVWLRLPIAALGSRGLAAGDPVRVHQRPYGMAFAFADDRQGAFFLALHPAWQQGLAAQAL